ncbi:hypothetical protein OMW55_12010 [Sphingomonas sp. BN140010]|uniref:Lipoprotein n=1 Tax=Sphingomonas arvum TaxID=2992113 RepID=A0ABT3JHH5_9SPHN|nr:hypothetical protein [Sphingomonas sp. BN140010]MCW3798531.1 hypothetical protein [Sphingomonas sp. BN140010]
MKNLTKFALVGLFASASSLIACRPAADRQDARLSAAEAARATASNDIDTLPPDESVATPTDQLANGSAAPASR